MVEIDSYSCDDVCRITLLCLGDPRSPCYSLDESKCPPKIEKDMLLVSVSGLHPYNRLMTMLFYFQSKKEPLWSECFADMHVGLLNLLMQGKTL